MFFYSGKYQHQGNCGLLLIYKNETWVESANVINGTDTPEVAAKKLQDGLDSWYKPAK